ncbi:uncharacterized protein LOC108094268 [Drosophila ficusphila]|uniref:uncharacterized protein LOC108094268 n=1 Tax=Drosophila ficusphila TaxID=30025 RepID=UPI0007E870D6|nr:uncharacterized protein LOC108094268 [Drosophila ficusphila]
MCSSPTNFTIKEDSSDSNIDPEALCNDLIGNILKEYPKRGIREESESLSSSLVGLPLRKCKSSVDRRLEYWKNMLIQRRKLQEKLRKETGRSPNQLIFTRENGIVKLSVKGFAEVVGLPKHSGAKLSLSKKNCLAESLPNICNLEVVGRSYKECQKALITVPSLKTTIKSDERSSGGDEVVQSIQPTQQPTSGPGVRINGVHYWPRVPEFSPVVDRTFTCNPFLRHLRTIVRIENCGSQKLHLSWHQVNYFSNNDTLMETEPGDFVFDVGPFVLFPGEFRDVTVLYQPRFVAIVKQRWLLCTKPRIFFCRPFGFTLNLNGRCTPPKEYLDRLDMEKIQMMPSEPQAYKVKPISFLCPYERELEEREVFNRRNRGFRCRRYEDLERLKAFSKKMKCPSSNPFPWDYSVHSLFHLISCDQDTGKRIQNLSELTQLLDDLRGPSQVPFCRADSLLRLKKRFNAKVIYVRGMLASRLKEWEERVHWLRSRTTRGGNKERKFFLDSIYIHLYGLICSAVEDVVSVIESTAQI